MVDAQILLGLLLTILPVFELRGGLPIIVEYAIRNNVSIWPYFLLVLILNVLVILLIFMFFDFLHDIFMRMGWYRAVIGRILKRLQKKMDKIGERMDRWGYFALMLFVAVPLPGTGAWTGAAVAWAMGLDRFKSFVSIAAGVIIAGLLVLLLSLGVLSFY
jgi:uncharacterized membrane protein